MRYLVYHKPGSYVGENGGGKQFSATVRKRELINISPAIEMYLNLWLFTNSTKLMVKAK